MKKVLCACLLIPVLLSAQDTLVFKNGDKKAGSLKEINGNEVKYTRSGQNDGPIYVVYKNELTLIKYGNGKIDTLSSESDSKKTGLEASFPKIKMEGSRLYYKSGVLEDYELKRLIEFYPYQQTKETMLAKYMQMEKYKRKKRLSKALIPVGCIFPAAGLISAFILFGTEPFGSDLPDIAFVSGVGLGLVTIGNGIAWNIHFGKKKNAVNYDISVLYNQMK